MTMKRAVVQFKVTHSYSDSPKTTSETWNEIVRYKDESTLLSAINSNLKNLNAQKYSKYEFIKILKKDCGGTDRQCWIALREGWL